MNPSDQVRLRHIRDALAMAVRFVEGRSRPDLDTDDMLRLALVQAVAIAGEAASKISAETRKELADLPWTSMAGMRNRLVHAYFDVNLDILWTTVTEAAPPVLRRLQILPEID
jgi:uncharacterized protein with HEPN domain